MCLDPIFWGQNNYFMVQRGNTILIETSNEAILKNCLHPLTIAHNTFFFLPFVYPLSTFLTTLWPFLTRYTLLLSHSGQQRLFCCIANFWELAKQQNNGSTDHRDSEIVWIVFKPWTNSVAWLVRQATGHPSIYQYLNHFWNGPKFH